MEGDQYSVSSNKSTVIPLICTCSYQVHSYVCSEGIRLSSFECLNERIAKPAPCSCRGRPDSDAVSREIFGVMCCPQMYESTNKHFPLDNGVPSSNTNSGPGLGGRITNLAWLTLGRGLHLFDTCRAESPH